MYHAEKKTLTDNRIIEALESVKPEHIDGENVNVDGKYYRTIKSSHYGFKALVSNNDEIALAIAKQAPKIPKPLKKQAPSTTAQKKPKAPSTTAPTDKEKTLASIVELLKTLI